VKLFAAQVLAVFWKDILSELRAKEILTSVFVFGLLVLVIFNFAFESRAETIELVAPGVLWVSFIFAGVLGLNRAFATEKDNGCLEGLMLCPVGRHVIFWGKLAGTFTFMLLVEIVILPIFLVLFNLPIWLPWLIPIIVLATLGFAAVGTVFSALASNTRARDIMLPILFFPITSPVIIGAVEATRPVINGESLGGDGATWLQIIIAFDVIFLVVSALVFEFVVEE